MKLKFPSVEDKGRNKSHVQTFFTGAFGARPSAVTGEGVMYVFCSVDGESEASIPKLIIKKQRFGFIK